MRAWLRRLLTRLVAITPAVITILTAGEQGTYQLLILSQVVLSLQLPFAVIPLIHFTSDSRRMGVFVNRGWVKVLAWTTATIIVGLNIRLVQTVVTEWISTAGEWRLLVLSVVLVLSALLLGLLLWVAFEPVLPVILKRRGAQQAVALPRDVAANLPTPAYRRILVPLDHTEQDRIAISHAAALARKYGAKLYLVHVEEDVTSQMYGDLSHTAEVTAGRDYLHQIAESLTREGLEVEPVLSHSNAPAAEIVKVAERIQPDLLIMGAHGHKGLKDLVFGNTINSVRHDVGIPILVVRDGG
jgi:manganese transport protein